MPIASIFRTIAGKVLEIDDTTVPYQQLEILHEFLAKQHFSLNTRSIDKFLRGLKKKHLVDSISVLNNNGELVVSSEGNGNSDAALAGELLRYIGAQLASPESVLIKRSNGWFMVFPFNGKTFVVKASASLSSIELRALARELDSLVSKKRIKE